jgi:hypothetical protein
MAYTPISPKKLAVLFLAFFAFHGFALWYHWYYVFPWLDVPMHMVGGFLCALLVLMLLRRYSGLLDHANDGDILFMVWGGVALIGIFWEFQEFFFDVFLTARYALDALQPNAADTLKDLADDLLGAFLAFSMLKMQRKATSE